MPLRPATLDNPKPVWTNISWESMEHVANVLLYVAKKALIRPHKEDAFSADLTPARYVGEEFMQKLEAFKKAQPNAPELKFTEEPGDNIGQTAALSDTLQTLIDRVKDDDSFEEDRYVAEVIDMVVAALTPGNEAIAEKMREDIVSMRLRSDIERS